MLIQPLNREDADVVLVAIRNVEGTTLPVDSLVQLDLSTDINGNRVVQPNTNELNASVGLLDEALDDDAYGLAQVFGYRPSSIVFQTNTSQAAGVKLVPVAGNNYVQSSASGDLLMVLAESIASSTASATISAKVHLRLM